jgi:hypothetical protein
MYNKFNYTILHDHVKTCNFSIEQGEGSPKFLGDGPIEMTHCKNKKIALGSMTTN